MKYLIYISLIAFFASCDSKTSKVSEGYLSSKPKADTTITDSVLTFQYEIDFSDKNISNKSDRHIDLLFNGVNNYFEGHRNPDVNFKTECLSCQPVHEYLGGLLFAKRLLITPDEIKYYKTDFILPDSVNRVNLMTDKRERTNPKFSFNEGKGNIRFIGVSCSDADFNEVQLSFPTGDVVVDSLINASFFEYDINKDGQTEQYLLGSRSCSQELVILTIRK